MRGRTEAPDTPRRDRHDYWGVYLDAPDGPALARFYAELLDWRLIESDDGTAVLEAPDGVAYLGCQTEPDYEPPVWPPEPGKPRMMMHLDFEVDDLEAASRHAVELGARLAGHQPQPDVRVHLDPAGHPFCLYSES